jgi:hypothetical protein
MASDPERILARRAPTRLMSSIAPTGTQSRRFMRDEEFRARLRAHGTTLHPIELAELSPRVAGKSLLHLQCHTGMDTMSWVKKGPARRRDRFLSEGHRSRSRPLQRAWNRDRVRRMRRLRRGRSPPAHVRRGVLLLRRPLLARRSATMGGQRGADWSRRAGCSTWSSSTRSSGRWPMTRPPIGRRWAMPTCLTRSRILRVRHRLH